MLVYQFKAIAVLLGCILLALFLGVAFIASFILDIMDKMEDKENEKEQ